MPIIYVNTQYFPELKQANSYHNYTSDQKSTKCLLAKETLKPNLNKNINAEKACNRQNSMEMLPTNKFIDTTNNNNIFDHVLEYIHISNTKIMVKKQKGVERWKRMYNLNSK